MHLVDIKEWFYKTVRDLEDLEKDQARIALELSRVRRELAETSKALSDWSLMVSRPTRN
jgi:hypothetical protein